MNGFVPTKNKDVFYMIILILTLIIVIIGATFAIFTYLKSQKEGSSAVYTGTLSIEYSSGNIINIRRLYPINNPNYDTTNSVYRNNFKVLNTGTLDSMVDIYLNLKENQFSNNTLRYYLYNKEKEVIADGSLYGKGEILIASNVVIKHDEEEDFVLLIWIEENNENQNSEMKKTLQGMIEVNANQKLE